MLHPEERKVATRLLIRWPERGIQQKHLFCCIPPSNPPICDLSLVWPLLKYHDMALSPPLNLALYKVTDNANETSSIAASAPPTPRETSISTRPADEDRPHTDPFTLPEYVTEVVL